MDKTFVMGEKLKTAVQEYLAVRAVVEEGTEWVNDPHGSALRLGRAERQVRVAFYQQFTDRHKGELSSKLIQEMVEDANEFMGQLCFGEVERVLEAKPA